MKKYSLYLCLFLLIGTIFVGSTFAEEDRFFHNNGAHEYRSWPLQIWYTSAITSGTKYDANLDQLPPGVERIKKFLLSAIEKQIQVLHYRHPAKTQSKYISLIIEDGGWVNETLPYGVAGMAKVDNDGFPVMYINPYMSSGLTDRTVAHEFFHLVQFTYDPNFVGAYEELNFSEGTAMWMERLLFEFDKYWYEKDYLAYFNAYYANPQFSLYGTSTDQNFKYGTVLWAIYLEQEFDQDIIREIWENYFSETSRNANYYSALYTATDKALKARGSSLATTYRGFAGWIYDKDRYRRDVDKFPDVPLYGIEDSAWYTIDSVSDAPQVMGSIFVSFQVPKQESDFYLNFEGASDAEWAVDFYSHGSGQAYKSKASGIVPIGYDKVKEFKVESKYIADDLVVVISPINSKQISIEEKPFEGYNYPLQFQGSFQSIAATNTQQIADINKNNQCGNNSTITSDGQCECKAGYVWASDAPDDFDCIAGDTVPIPTPVQSGGLFSDVLNNHPNATAIEALRRYGIIAGYPDGTFKPENKVNRAELMKILVNAKVGSPAAYGDCFPDVKTEWFAPFVCYAQDKGWIAGYPNGTFKPSQAVNRAEAIKMVIEAFKDVLPSTGNTADTPQPYTDVKKDQWFGPYVLKAKTLGILDDLPKYNPTYEMKRGDISEIIYRTFAIQHLRAEKYEKNMDEQMLSK